MDGHGNMHGRQIHAAILLISIGFHFRLAIKQAP